MTTRYRIEHNDPPKLKRPKFHCDVELCPSLNSNPVTAMMNRSSTAAFLGPPGSGKTTQMLALLAGAFAKKFHSVHSIIPLNSRSSMGEKCVLNQLPEDQLYEECSAENLTRIHNIAKGNAKEEMHTLVLFDDVQDAFKNKHVAKILLKMICNRRHLRLSLWFACQNWVTIPLQVRKHITNLFIWKLSKNEMKILFEEKITSQLQNFEHLLSSVFFRQPHDAMYFNSENDRMFRLSEEGWDEVVEEEK